jgi:hypothetical protein
MTRLPPLHPPAPVRPATTDTRRDDPASEFHEWLARALQGHAAIGAGLGRWLDRVEMGQ